MENKKITTAITLAGAIGLLLQQGCSPMQARRASDDRVAQRGTGSTEQATPKRSPGARDNDGQTDNSSSGSGGSSGESGSGGGGGGGSD
jgi:hypothetical protein